MAEESIPFDAGAGSVVNEDAWRRMARGFADDGLILAVSSEGKITGGGGAAVTRGACPIGFLVDGFHYRDTASSTRTVAANASSSPRRDRAVLRLDPALNKITWEIKLGAPAANPVAPALTRDRTGIWEVPLGSWTMPGSASAQVPTSYEDERPMPGEPAQGMVALNTRPANAGPVTALATVGSLTCQWVQPFIGDRRVRVQFEPKDLVVNAASAVQVRFLRNGVVAGGDKFAAHDGSGGLYFAPFTDLVVPPGLSTYDVQVGNYYGGSFTVTAEGPMQLSVTDMGPAR